MSRKTWLFAIVICGASLALVSPIIIWVYDENRVIEKTAPRNPLPIAIVPERNIDVGVVSPGQTLEDCVILRNAGMSVLQAIPGPTGCRAPHPVSEKLKILPGGQKGIDVRIDGSAQPETYTHDFIIHTNDPHNPRIQIWMTYTVADL